MSYKVKTFATSVFMPLTVSNFVIEVPGLLTGSATVQSTTFPGLNVAETTLYFRGREVSVPIRPLYGPGEWSILVPDNILGMNGFSFQENVVAQSSPTIIGDRDKMYRLFDINVYPYTGMSLLLSKVTSSLGSVTKYIPAETLSYPAILIGATLKGCYIKSIKDVGLDAANPTTPWKWEIVFKYNAVSHAVVNSSNIAKKIKDLVNKDNGT